MNDASKNAFYGGRVETFPIYKRRLVRRAWLPWSRLAMLTYVREKNASLYYYDVSSSYPASMLSGVTRPLSCRSPTVCS